MTTFLPRDHATRPDDQSYHAYDEVDGAPATALSWKGEELIGFRVEAIVYAPDIEQARRHVNAARIYLDHARVLDDYDGAPVAGGVSDPAEASGPGACGGVHFGDAPESCKRWLQGRAAERQAIAANMEAEAELDSDLTWQERDTLRSFARRLREDGTPETVFHYYNAGGCYLRTESVPPEGWDVGVAAALPLGLDEPQREADIRAGQAVERERIRRLAVDSRAGYWFPSDGIEKPLRFLPFADLLDGDADGAPVLP